MLLSHNLLLLSLLLQDLLFHPCHIIPLLLNQLFLHLNQLLLSILYNIINLSILHFLLLHLLLLFRLPIDPLDLLQLLLDYILGLLTESAPGALELVAFFFPEDLGLKERCCLAFLFVGSCGILGEVPLLLKGELLVVVTRLLLVDTLNELVLDFLLAMSTQFGNVCQSGRLEDI